MRLKTIGAMSCGIMSGVLYALMGLIFGAIVSIIAAMGFAMGGSGSGEQYLGVIFGVGAVIFIPIFYGVIGFIGGLIMAALYNLVAGFTGGIELEFEDNRPGPAPMTADTAGHQPL